MVRPLRLWMILFPLTLLLSPVAMAAGHARPNFIFFLTDDISQGDLGCYGNRAIHTPNVDKLAAEGLVFDNAYLTISSCSPTRCSIITGRYPHNTGAAELHTPLPPGHFLFPQALKEAGYYTVLSGKHHMGKNADPAFVKISKGKGPGNEGDWVDILRNRPKDKPFFFWFASTDAHRGWSINDQAPVYRPDQVIVPPYLYDGPLTRADLAGYYHEVSRTDYFAGQLRAELERQGIAGQTYFIYCSDNGRGFPRCKTYLYDSGIKTPLIIWSPGRIKPGRSASLVSVIDFAPTILELAGVKPSPRLQGVSFAALLTDPTKIVRDYVFAEHNWHVYQSHVRMVRHGPWVYIRNAWPQRYNLCMESGPDFPVGRELWEAYKQGKLKPYQALCITKPQPAEQLYNVQDDPDQLVNLAGVPDHAAVMAKLRHALDQWVEQTGDTIPSRPSNDRYLPPPGSRKRDPNHHYGIQPGAERNAMQINRPGPIRDD